MRCKNCGNEIPENSKYCNSCGADQTQEPLSSTTSKIKYYKKNWFIILMLIIFFPIGVYLMWKEKKFHKIVRIILSAILGLNFIFWLLLIVILLLPCPHDWIDATCTEPMICNICGETEGEPLGHIEGDWDITKEPTLINEGRETLYCNRCNNSIDNHTIEKKLPKVDGTSFNFRDEEFIDWINDKSTAKVDDEDLGLYTKNTSYRITLSDGTKGAFILNHDAKENITAIMIWFDDWEQASAMAIWIGEKIDSKFSADDAFYPIVNDDSYTSADMTAMRLNLDTDFEVSVLAPSEFFAEILE